jgi:hypothetical protein
MVYSYVSVRPLLLLVVFFDFCGMVCLLCDVVPLHEVSASVPI